MAVIKSTRLNEQAAAVEIDCAAIRMRTALDKVALLDVSHVAGNLQSTSIRNAHVAREVESVDKDLCVWSVNSQKRFDRCPTEDCLFGAIVRTNFYITCTCPGGRAVPNTGPNLNSASKLRVYACKSLVK